jgi:tetratricopeptide (TPR) repeat protein
VASPASINPVDFVTRVQPLLERQDLQGLLQLLKSRWTYEQLKALIASKHCDARKVAILAVALVGGPCVIPILVEQLKDGDACANQMAEHALWSIWFRTGSQEANRLLKEGSARMEQKDFAEAEAQFTAAIEADPSFAEAYNQRAIVRYLTERYEESIEDGRQTVERMPCHFGAWAGLGHCYAHLGQIIEAIRAYKKALEINPHLECVAEMIAELRRK